LPIRGSTYYRVDSAEGYEEFYRHLTGQPRRGKPAVGKLKALPPIEPQSHPPSLDTSTQAKPPASLDERNRVQNAGGTGIAQAFGQGATATVNITGFTPYQIATLLKTAGAAQQARVNELATQLNTSRAAVHGFLNILKEDEGPIEELPTKLTLIAQWYVSMLDRLAALDPKDADARGFIDEAREVLRRATSIDDKQLLRAEAIQFHSCFISYSTKDQEFAERLYADLQNNGVRCWFAPHDIQGGKKLHEQIDEAIRIHDRLLLILSESSMHSEWVKTEISKARQREKQEKRRVLFPLRLVDFETLQRWESFDGDTGKDSAREIREYYVPDFTKWKDHEAYQKEFQRLIRDLEAERK
jgi:hypothetical protein